MRVRNVHDYRIDLSLVIARLDRVQIPNAVSGETLVALGEVKILTKELEAISDDSFMRRKKELNEKFFELGMPLELNSSMVEILEISKILNDF